MAKTKDEVLAGAARARKADLSATLSNINNRLTQIERLKQEETNLLNAKGLIEAELADLDPVVAALPPEETKQP